jgi:hypothetical protein
MRGRKPRPFAVAPGDLPLLQEVARSRSLLFFPVPVVPKSSNQLSTSQVHILHPFQ